MKNRYLIFAVAIVCLTVFGCAQVWASEAYLMATDEYGDNYYTGVNEDGTLTGQAMLPDNIGWSPYGTGIGDFDNDGDLDFIVASGYMSGTINLLEKTGTGNQFAPPAAVASWSFMYFQVSDMAVADFNGDGNLDFVLTYFWSGDSELFLGDGQLGFGAPILLPGTSPFDSHGADAADFDNDGFYDFVSVPSSDSTMIYLNFGDGIGGFTTVQLECYDLTLYTGVAAADFNGDGHIDLAATASGAIDIYLGDGQRGFQYSHRIEDPKIWDSPMDSYDINGDRKQDLILASYGDSTSSTDDVIAVFIGDGLGGFTATDTYPGGDGFIRVSIAAPNPPKEVPNEDPVAVIEPNELNVEAGQLAEFSAAASHDPDGEIVSYSWDFGNAEPAAVMAMTSAATMESGNAVNHVFDQPGDYTITLTVTDDRGATNSITAVAHVTAPKIVVKGRSIFMPKALNLKSKGRWVKAYIRVPKKYRGAELNRDSLYLVDPATGEKIAAAGKVSYKKWWKVYVARFDRQALISHIGDPERRVTRVKLQVEGELLHKDGPVDLEAKGKIKAIKPKPRKKHWRAVWKQLLAACWKYRR